MSAKDGPVFDTPIQAPLDPPEVGATSVVFQFRAEDHTVRASVSYGVNAQYIAVALLDPVVYPGPITGNDIREALASGNLCAASEVLAESPIAIVLPGNYEPGKEYRAVAVSWLIY